MKALRGFTLLEIIGVIAIMAIMAAALAPSLVRSVDRAYADAEARNLQVLAQGLQDYVRRVRRIPAPNPNDWGPAIASQQSLTEMEVRENARGYRRAIYFDPRFFSATETAFTGYTQTTGLAAAPFLPRAIIVSDLGVNVPSSVGTGIEFDRIWDQDPAAIVFADEDTKIERVNFQSLFERVLLTNAHTQLPAYSLETGAAVAVPAAGAGGDGSLIRYVLSGTQLQLFAAPFPSGGLDTSVLVTGDLHRHFATDGTNWFWERP